MKTLRVISLFAGAGGLDYGIEAAGFESLVAVEWDHDSCETMRANRPWQIIEKNIHDVTSQEILDVGALKSGQVELLVGGPPCQPFSKSAYWVSGDTKRLSDPRADTLTAFMRCVSDLLPEVFVLENVHGITYSGKEEGFRFLQNCTQEINQRKGTAYRLSWSVLNTADYGVPQTRKRFFLVGHREGKKFKFPSPTHREPSKSRQLTLFDTPRPRHVTAWDAIGGMNVSRTKDTRATGRWGDILPSIPEGQNYLWHTNRKGGLPLFGWRTRYWSFLLKLAKNRPSWTIQAQPGPAIGPFHWENRRLSVAEMARLQTFPEDIVFTGSRRSIQKQIGNAVPSLMGEILAREIAKQFFGARTQGPLKYKVELKRPIPQPEPVQLVPEKYLGLVGKHADHPGEGKGKQAKQARSNRANVGSLLAT